MQDIKNIIESLLFIADKPLTLERIKQVLTEADAKEIRDAIATLIQEYRDRDGGFYLNEVAGGYQFRSQPRYREWIKLLVKPNPVRLSKAALETLAIIAYKQPIIRSDIEHIRGVDSGGVIRALMERKLIRVLGRKEIPGRPLIYATTREFLEVFDLKNLKDLPTPQEIESLEKTPPPPASPEEGPVAADEIAPESSTSEVSGTQSSDPVPADADFPSETREAPARSVGFSDGSDPSEMARSPDDPALTEDTDSGIDETGGK